MWKRFDLIRITTTKNIKFLSGPPQRPANPDGIWSVVGNIPGKASLMAAKDRTIIVVPLTDVIKVADYDLKGYIEKIKSVRKKKDLTGDDDGQKEKRK